MALGEMGKAAAGGGAAGGKLCVRCGEDCADRPRVKTRDGRYMCKACEAQLATQSRAAATAPAPSPTNALAPASDGTIPLADDQTIPIAVDTTIPLEEPEPRRSPKDAFRPKGVPTGTAAVAAGVGASPAVSACVKCGYALDGVNSPRCPECGTLNTKYAVRRERDAQDSAEVERKAYMQPIALFLICFAATAMLALGDRGVEFMIARSVFTLVWGVLGFIVFTVCCLIWIGFDAPWHLNLVRFLAISAATAAIYQAVGLLPGAGLLMIVWNVGVMIVYIGMLQKFLDLDLQDALLVGVITTAMRWGLGLLAAVVLA